MPIHVTRKLLTTALDGSLIVGTSFRTDPYFGFLVPCAVPGIQSDLLDPDEFAMTAKKLVEMFRANFVKFEPYVDSKVIEAQPTCVVAADES
jgi:phosphoenolpyruvate carboxykinase (ATP)